MTKLPTITKTFCSVDDDSLPNVRKRSRFARRRATVLALVYVAMAAHVAHWKLTGKTLAPLELNEVMYTLELGIVTAGFIFMAAATLSAGIFGRFFCSWGCHILALQDLCAWLLRKIRIKPRPVRSRMLILVPVGAMIYMFLWPTAHRLLATTWPGLTSVIGVPKSFTMRIASDADGWASFVTQDFWRNLPGPGIAILTFAVCGFLIVYVLGSRGFCRYGCPYGVVFGLADRVAPGRVYNTTECIQCARCTAVCPSGLPVHEEIAQYGRVVSPNCLKDLNCVSACPVGNLRFGFTKPAGFASIGKDHPRTRYDFSMREEIVIALVFGLSFFAFRGLYGLVPFLLSLGIGGILSYLVVIGWRLFRQRSLKAGGFRLKHSGRLTQPGWVYASSMAAVFLLTLHCCFIRYHEISGERAFERLQVAWAEQEDIPGGVGVVLRHHEARQRWGLHPGRDIGRDLALAMVDAGRSRDAVTLLRDVLRVEPRDLHCRLALGRALATLGENGAARAEWKTIADLERSFLAKNAGVVPIVAAAHENLGKLARQENALDDAQAWFRSALTLEPHRYGALVGLGELSALKGDWKDAISHMRSALDAQPHNAEAHYNLAVMLALGGHGDDAERHYRESLRIDPEDAQCRNNLGFLLAARGDEEEAEAELRRAIALAPGYAEAHLNLGRLLHKLGRRDEADVHLRKATELMQR